MSDEKRQLSKQELLDEEEQIMKEVLNDPDVQDAKAPPELRDRIFREIRAKEEEKAKHRLTAEEQELIRLGKLYKRKRKNRKYLVLAAAIVLLLAIGVTSVGGPKRVIEIVKFNAGKDQQVRFNTGDNIGVVEGDNEEQTYQEIEEIYGFTPVRMQYMPQGTSFYKSVIGKENPIINVMYRINDEASINYAMYPNYRRGSFAQLIEDELKEDYVMNVQDVTVNIRKFEVDGSLEQWNVIFVHKNVGYIMTITGQNKVEVEKIVKNLKFF